MKQRWDKPVYHRTPVAVHSFDRPFLHAVVDGQHLWTFRNNVAAGTPRRCGDGPTIWSFDGKNFSGHYIVHNRTSEHVWVCNWFDVALKRLIDLERSYRR